MSSSDMDGRSWIRSTGSSRTPTKSSRCAVLRSDPLPFTRNTRWGVPSNAVSVCFSEMLPPFQFVTDGSCPRMCARYISSSTPVRPLASASFQRFFSIAMTCPLEVEPVDVALVEHEGRAEDHLAALDLDRAQPSRLEGRRIERTLAERMCDLHRQVAEVARVPQHDRVDPAV